MVAARKGEGPHRPRQGNRVVLLWFALYLATLWRVLALEDSLSSQPDSSAQSQGPHGHAAWGRYQTPGSPRGRYHSPASVAPDGAAREPDGFLSHTLPNIEPVRYNRLGLIITRVDSGEQRAPRGSYTLLLR